MAWPRRSGFAHLWCAPGLPITEWKDRCTGRCELVAEVVSYIILVGGVIGIGLGIFGLLRPNLKKWRVLLPSLPRRYRDTEDGLEDIDDNADDEDDKSFRTVFKAPARSAPAAAALPDPPDTEDPPDPEIRVVKLTGDDPLGLLDDMLPPPKDLAAPTHPDIDEEEAAELAALLADISEAPVNENPPPTPETQAAPLDESGDLDLLSLFGEASESYSTPDALRSAIPRITASALLIEAREVQELMRRVAESQDKAK